MKTYFIAVAAVLLIVAAVVSVNSLSVYAQGGGANMTGVERAYPLSLHW